MNSTQLNSAILEILLHIGNSFETKKVVNEALISYIQQLNLAGIVLYKKKDINYTVHTMKPKNLKSDETIFKIFDTMLLNINKFEKKYFDKNIPYIKIKNQNSYYIYKLQDFGFLMFIKNDKIINDNIHKALRQVNSKFSTSLIACDNLTQLQDINLYLENKIEEEVENNRKKDFLLTQQSKLAQMGDMISMIAHQWRQPLNAISASSINISLMSSMGILEDFKVQDNSKFIQEQTQKMSQTIDTFMNFVKPAKESKEFKPSHTVEAIMQIMGTQLANHNIEVNIESKNEDISLVGFEDLLEQVIINLLANARDAFEELDIENKKIDITIDTKNNIPIIIVEDNAGGIPKDVADKIFNPYFTTKEQGKGTGIGLYMSMDIMKKSFNGDLVYSAIDNGSRFEIVCGE